MLEPRVYDGAVNDHDRPFPPVFIDFLLSICSESRERVDFIGGE